MAMKRNAWHLGAAALADTLDLRFSKQTITRWERQLAASVLCAFRDWYAQNFACIRFFINTSLAGQRVAMQYDRRHYWAVHLVRCDATNTSVLQSDKAFTCEICARFRSLDPSLDAGTMQQMPEPAESDLDTAPPQPPPL
jgi:hypothetical protein